MGYCAIGLCILLRALAFFPICESVKRFDCYSVSLSQLPMSAFFRRFFLNPHSPFPSNPTPIAFISENPLYHLSVILYYIIVFLCLIRRLYK